MAEYLLRHRLAQTRVWDGRVLSAGVSALTMQPADRVVVMLMMDRNIDITSHRAIQLTDQHVREADLVLVMEKCHREVVLELDPAARGKTFLLGHWSDTEIRDPYLCSKKAYLDALQSIDIGLTAWVDKMGLCE
jgi:protein-tyrosine phosphatase